MLQFYINAAAVAAVAAPAAAVTDVAATMLLLSWSNNDSWNCCLFCQRLWLLILAKLIHFLKSVASALLANR